MSLRQWFRFQNAADDPSSVDIHIIDFIGSWDDDWIARNFGMELGVTARAFVEALAQIPADVKTLNVHINSPGGDIQGGINIANALREQQASKGRTVHTFIDGIAASIASVIAMAGDTVSIADNALVMVHNPWGLAVGSAAEMRKTAAVLDTMRGQIVNTYKWHSSLDDAELVALMDAETWMDADEAIAKGFATDKIAGLKAAASIDPKALSRLTIPDRYRDRVNAFLKPAPSSDAPAAAADVLRLCTEAGLDLAFANAVLAEQKPVADVAARVTAEKARRVQAEARAVEIRGLCATAKLADRADLYIKSALSIDDVKRDLTTLTGQLDAVQIDTSLRPDHGTKKIHIDHVAVYAAMNGVTAKKE